MWNSRYLAVLLTVGLQMTCNVVAHENVYPDPATRHRCSTKDPSEGVKEKESRAVQKWHRAHDGDHGPGGDTSHGIVQAELCQQCVNIDVYFHVLETTGNGGSSLYVMTDSILQAQFDVLQELFAPTPFTFTYKGVTRTVNDVWANEDLNINEDMVIEIGRALRIGEADDLNVYFSDGVCLNAGGFAYIPSNFGTFPVDTYDPHDGIWMCTQAILGGIGFGQNDQGKTLVHEAGHWFGLLHTFEGRNCSVSNTNDLVADTPQQDGPTDGGCPVGRDSCPDLDGFDPIHNYMDYSSDYCYEEFSPGQIERMFISTDLYRRNLDATDCVGQQIPVSVEMLTDGTPEENYYALVDVEENIFIDSLADPTLRDFANKLLSKVSCIEPNRLNEFFLLDDAFDGIQSPGYASFSIDGTEQFRVSEFTDQFVNYLTYMDVYPCAQQQQRRLTLIVDFDGWPHETTWEIRRQSDGALLLDASDTFVGTDANYDSRFINSTLYVDRCVDVGTTYEVTVIDSWGDGIIPPGGYKVLLDDELIDMGGDFLLSAVTTVEVTSSGNDNSDCRDATAAEMNDLLETLEPEEYSRKGIRTCEWLASRPQDRINTYCQNGATSTLCPSTCGLCP